MSSAVIVLSSETLKSLKKKKKKTFTFSVSWLFTFKRYGDFIYMKELVWFSCVSIFTKNKEEINSRLFLAKSISFQLELIVKNKF